MLKHPALFWPLAAAAIAGLFALGLCAATGRITSPEQYAAAVAGALPFGYAFAAGMVASVNPCGFFMLPVFIGRRLEGDSGQQGDLSLRRLGRGALLGLWVTLGFVALFSAIGAIISMGGDALIDAFPWMGLAIGIAMAWVGAWLLATGRPLGLAWAGRLAGRESGGGPRGEFLYGVAYGAVSLSCTLPVFLVVVGSSLAGAGLLASLGQFVSYALGMGAVVTALSLAAATMRGALAPALRRVAPHVHRLSALFLLGAGLYLIVYWVWLGDVLG